MPTSIGSMQTSRLWRWQRRRRQRFPSYYLGDRQTENETERKDGQSDERTFGRMDVQINEPHSKTVCQLCFALHRSVSGLKFIEDLLEPSLHGCVCGSSLRWLASRWVLPTRKRMAGCGTPSQPCRAFPLCFHLLYILSARRQGNGWLLVVEFPLRPLEQFSGLRFLFMKAGGMQGLHAAARNSVALNLHEYLPIALTVSLKSRKWRLRRRRKSE